MLKVAYEGVKLKRTNYCGKINEEYLDKEVSIAGWVSKKRSLGSIIFLDLKDKYGIVQCTIHPESSAFNIANNVKNNYVLTITGTVQLRPEENINLYSGRVEIVVNHLTILNTAIALPILDDDDTNELQRMSHRVLDLRRKELQDNLNIRHKLCSLIRDYLNHNDFTDIETPLLTLATTGGAKEFIVPSSIQKKHFYALPQSPQIFKQLLMFAGFDKYYQIVRCFRDEPLRSDRQPEFTQLDIETSFWSQEQIIEMMEDLIKIIFKKIKNIDIMEIPIISYWDAINMYGTDKPDLRIPFKIDDLTGLFKADTQCINFSQIANSSNGKIGAIDIPVNLSRSKIDYYKSLADKISGLQLSFFKTNSDGKVSSSIIKFLSEDIKEGLKQHTSISHTLLIIAGNMNTVCNTLGELRRVIAIDFDLIAQNTYEVLWVNNFPLFEYDESSKCYTANHHPFTAPIVENMDLLESNPDLCQAQAYDLVINGWEVGGGSIRIHDINLQQKVFNILGIDSKEQKEKFGYLLENLQYGAPPHGGIAVGIDRLTAILCSTNSIRDVIAFPKTNNGTCLLTSAPSKLNTEILQSLDLYTIG